MNSASPPPESPVPSPCNSICTIDQVSGCCTGCFRTLDEIAMWSVLDDAEKREVWRALELRRAAAEGNPRPWTGTDAER
jgi:predicted Fe-S protein YdhL (DUF1289 family)